jgi:hypothetical protein
VPQESNEYNKVFNQISSRKTRAITTLGVTSRVKVSNDEKGTQQPPKRKEGKYDTIEIEGVNKIHNNDNDECFWHEWIIPFHSPSQTSHGRSSNGSPTPGDNKQSQIGGQDFRGPLLVANEGDFVVRDFFDDNDDAVDLESIHLLHDSRHVSSSCPSPSKNKNSMQLGILAVASSNNNLNRGNDNHGYMSNKTSVLLSSRHRKQEDDETIALLSEHDRLGDERHGSYDVDQVDEDSVAGGTSALQELPIYRLGQNVAQEEADRRDRKHANRYNSINNKNRYPSQRCRPSFIVLPCDNDEQDVTIQRDIGSPPGDQPLIQVLGLRNPREEDDPETAPTQLGYSGHYDGDGATTASWSAELQSRQMKQKTYRAHQLWQSRRSLSSNTLEAMSHGELWTLPELPSEDERTSSSFTTITTKSTVSPHPMQQRHHQQQHQQREEQLHGGIPNLTSRHTQPHPTTDISSFKELPKPQHPRHQHSYTRSHNISSLARQAASQSMLGILSSQPPHDEECLLVKLPQEQELRKLNIV